MFSHYLYSLTMPARPRGSFKPDPPKVGNKKQKLTNVSVYKTHVVFFII